MQPHNFDFLVIGSGIAGLTFALKAAKHGTVGVVTKKEIMEANTAYAQGGIAGVFDTEQDSFEKHIEDTLEAGAGLCNREAVECIVRNAPRLIKELMEMGAEFTRKEGELHLGREGGHSENRIVHAADATGWEIERALVNNIRNHPNIEIFEHHFALELLTEHHLGKYVTGRDPINCFGAYILDEENERIRRMLSKVTVLAAGGAGQVYLHSTNPEVATGDGIAMAYRAKGRIENMEFVQFHPTGMMWPPSVKGTLITEGVRGEGGVLKNSEGKRFMFDYVPDMYQDEFADTEEEANEWVKAVVNDKIPEARRPPELLTRDVVARAILNEVEEGRGAPHGGVFLDIASQRPETEIKRKLPSMYHQFKELADIDITEVPMEVGPTCHYMMGGVRVDPETQETTLPGLFAAGEVATGLHGSNRLGGNSLSDLLVFGKRAGEYAAKFAGEIDQQPALDESQINEAVSQSHKPFESDDGENPYDIMHDLQKMMQKKVGIIRTEEGLKSAINDIENMRERAKNTRVSGNVQFNPGWHLALDLNNMLDISEAVARAALRRTESRGAHTREDHPGSDDDWGDRNLVIRQNTGGLEVKEVPLEKPPKVLDELLQE